MYVRFVGRVCRGLDANNVWMNKMNGIYVRVHVCIRSTSCSIGMADDDDTVPHYSLCIIYAPPTLEL